MAANQRDQAIGEATALQGMLAQAQSQVALLTSEQHAQAGLPVGNGIVNAVNQQLGTTSSGTRTMAANEQAGTTGPTTTASSTPATTAAAATAPATTAAPPYHYPAHDGASNDSPTDNGAADHCRRRVGRSLCRRTSAAWRSLARTSRLRVRRQLPNGHR